MSGPSQLPQEQQQQPPEEQSPPPPSEIEEEITEIMKEMAKYKNATSDEMLKFLRLDRTKWPRRRRRSVDVQTEGCGPVVEGFGEEERQRVEKWLSEQSGDYDYGQEVGLELEVQKEAARRTRQMTAYRTAKRHLSTLLAMLLAVLRLRGLLNDEVHHYSVFQDVLHDMMQAGCKLPTWMPQRFEDRAFRYSHYVKAIPSQLDRDHKLPGRLFGRSRDGSTTSEKDPAEEYRHALIGLEEEWLRVEEQMSLASKLSDEQSSAGDDYPVVPVRHRRSSRRKDKQLTSPKNRNVECAEGAPPRRYPVSIDDQQAGPSWKPDAAPATSSPEDWAVSSKEYSALPFKDEDQTMAEVDVVSRMLDLSSKMEILLRDHAWNVLLARCPTATKVWELSARIGKVMEELYRMEPILNELDATLRELVEQLPLPPLPEPASHCEDPSSVWLPFLGHTPPAPPASPVISPPSPSPEVNRSVMDFLRRIFTRRRLIQPRGNLPTYY